MEPIKVVEEPTTQDQANLKKIIPLILELQKQKSSVYGRSYCRHGDISIFFNLERKWDRISNIIEQGMKNGMDTIIKSGTANETFFDTVIDLASYSLLWAGYICETHPEVLEQFIKSNQLDQTI